MTAPPASTPSTSSTSASSAAPLAIRLPNWVGDACMALPALTLLHRALRDGGGAAPVLFGKRWAADLFAGMGWRVEPLPVGVRAQARAVAASGAREGVLFTNSFGSAMAFRWAGVRSTGYRGDFRSWLLARAIPRRVTGHEVEAFWHVALAHLGEPGPAQPPEELGLRLHDRHREQASAALGAAAVPKGYAVLCPLAVGSAAGKAKVWPAFPLLCRGLIEAGHAVVACPGPGEEAACAAALPGARLLPGLGLGAYAAVLAGAAGVAANDSGPMHLAAAVGAPVIGIFGVSDPRRTAPWSDLATVCGSSGGWPAVREVAGALEAVLKRSSTVD